MPSLLVLAFYLRVLGLQELKYNYCHKAQCDAYCKSNRIASSNIKYTSSVNRATAGPSGNQIGGPAQAPQRIVHLIGTRQALF